MTSLYSLINPNNLIIAAILCDTIPNEILRLMPGILSKSVRNTIKQYVTPCTRFITAVSLASRLSIMPNHQLFDTLLSIAGVTHLLWSNQADMYIENTYDSYKLAEQLYLNIKEEQLSNPTKSLALNDDLKLLEEGLHDKDKNIEALINILHELKEKNINIDSQNTMEQIETVLAA